MTIEQAIREIIRGRYGVSTEQLFGAIKLLAGDHSPDKVVGLLDQMQQCAGYQTHCSYMLEAAQNAVQRAKLELKSVEIDAEAVYQHFDRLVAEMDRKRWPSGVPVKISEPVIGEELENLSAPLYHAQRAARHLLQ